MSLQRKGENCVGWAARDESGFLSPFSLGRRPTNKTITNRHEIVGIVKEVGANVSKFKVGDCAGVVTYLDTCRDCNYCNEGLEVHCSKGFTLTINGIDVDGNPTRGGYSSFVVVHERYCYKIPENYPPESAAPLLCAGITVYTPMMQHKMNAQPGKSFGVIGLGGLGHMAVKFGKAFGLKVTVLSTSLSKKDDALNLLGADEFILSSDKEQMDVHVQPKRALLMLRLDAGTRSIAGSAVGTTKPTQETIDFCAEHKIYPEIELIPIQYANEALERLEKSDLKYRFVIDIANSLN
ncbi:hypothetical protein CDL15_Pgr000454 [Punica granatum]|uniref:cinnamyl-alcohol dehydrogenase n=1 Tax=Punica granatum TaxID=22663 RepID=A0A218W4H3_PUNGR|nr:hypothetical protein CDL15_Pgr000454 [Punica granatum]